MGSSASKAARKYPEAIGKVVAEHGMKRPSVLPPASAHLAETHKSEAIERDSVDPHFLANLNKLGPVRVDHHMQSIRPEATNTKQLFESRQEESDTQLLPMAGRNRLYGFSLSELLDKQKDVKTEDGLVKLAEEFKIDVDKLRRLVKFVNSPSVDKASIRPAPGSKKGEDLWVANAVWVEGSY